MQEIQVLVYIGTYFEQEGDIKEEMELTMLKVKERIIGVERKRKEESP